MTAHGTNWKPENLDVAILKFWQRGLDTMEISDKVSRYEHEIYNRLWHLRAKSTKADENGNLSIGFGHY